MKLQFPTRLAEIIYAFIMGFFGITHFMNPDKMSSMLPDFMPFEGVTWIYISGAALIAAALAILVNKLKKLTCYLLAALLIIIVFTVHLESAREGNPGQMLKDLGLAMAAIMIGNRNSKK